MSAFTIVTRRSIRLIPSIAVLFEARHSVGLVLLGQRLDGSVDVAVHSTVEVGEVVPKTPVGETVLREVVGAHLLRALTPSDLGVTRGRLAGRALFGRPREEPRAEHRHRLRLVLE